MMRVVSGIQPTGPLHWGNYFGAIRQWVELQHRTEAYFFVANLHALTTVHDPNALEQLSLDLVVDLLALGVDPARAALFLQSEVPAVTELCWILMSSAPLGVLERSHAYKDRKARGLATNAGVLAYPVLMAADILAYDADEVPAGEDQLQHLEICRDLAHGFNTRFGATLKLPRAQIAGAGRVPGVDGGKMSKSRRNAIDVFEAAHSMRRKIMLIKTDSRPPEQPKDPEGDVLFQLYALLASVQQRDAMAALYRRGGFAYGHVKEMLADAAQSYFAEARMRRHEFAADPARVRRILDEGAARARSIADATLARTMKARGLAERARDITDRTRLRPC